MAAVNASDVASFEATIQQCRGGTIVAVDGKKCNPSLRGWCLYEWDKTEANYGIEGLFMTGMTPEDRKRVVEGVNVANAECFDASDLAMIHRNIIASHGSLEKFDERLKLLLLLEPLSYKEDLQQLARRSADTRFDFRPVYDWLDSGASTPLRCLVIADGAGKGKSTISAALIRSVLGRGPVSAHHLIKFSDQRRRDPVAMLKSIVYQLAQGVEAVRDLVFQLDVMEVDMLRDLDAAWKLLGPCLEKGCAGEEVIVLIDALDEGDPPEQQRADFDPAMGSIEPVGNLSLIHI